MDVFANDIKLREVSHTFCHLNIDNCRVNFTSSYHIKLLDLCDLTSLTTLLHSQLEIIHNLKKVKELLKKKNSSRILNLFCIILQKRFNPLMHNVPKWSDRQNFAANAAGFLKCV